MTTPAKFLEKLKDPKQAEMKEMLISMLEDPDCKVLNVEYNQYSEDDFRIVVSFSAK
jgi:hypothetical protein